jgi:hypothetical protein
LTPPYTKSEKFGKTSFTVALPVRASRRSKYICTQAGMPLIRRMSAVMVSPTMASTFVSQSAMLLVAKLGMRFFSR